MTVLSASLMVLTLAMLAWLGRAPKGLSASDRQQEKHATDAASDNVFYLGLVPQRDIFTQRRRYRALADYLSSTLGRPVTLVTSSTYHGVLNDMAQRRIDGAFVGSMVAALAQDPLRARILVKSQTADGVTACRGVIFVRDDSPIHSLDGLAGRSIAVVRTTTAGHLFPVYVLTDRGLLTGEDAVVMRWVGTHDRAIQEVYEDRVDAGAAKDLRLDAFEQAHQGYRFRRLTVSEEVPNNTLIVRRDLDEAFTRELQRALLEMDQHEDGREALSAFGASRFVTCRAQEYRVVYDMARRLGPGGGKAEPPNAPTIPWDATHADVAVEPEIGRPNPAPEPATKGP